MEPLVGIAYRRELADDIAAHPGAFDCLEIMVEHFLPLTNGRRDELARLREDFVLVPHGVSLSLGSTTLQEDAYWQGVREIVDLVDAPLFGEHASISRAGGYDVHHLTPLWRTQEQLDQLVRNLIETAERLERPVVLETITQSIDVGGDLPWDEFLVEAATRAGASLLVDVTNLWVNRENGIGHPGGDLLGGLGAAPWGQFHMAGVTQTDDGLFVDSHDHDLTPELRVAFAETAAVQVAPYTIIERDRRLDEDFEPIVADVAALREVVRR